MTVHLANVVARAACDAINARINAANPTPGKLRIYSGTRPATADDPLPGGTNLLVEFTFGNPAFQPAAEVGNNATAAANPIAPVTAVGSGTATFFTVVEGDDDMVFTGKVTDTAGDGDLKLSTTAIATGIDVSVVTLNASMPEGA